MPNAQKNSPTSFGSGAPPEIKNLSLGLRRFLSLFSTRLCASLEEKESAPAANLLLPALYAHENNFLFRWLLLPTLSMILSLILSKKKGTPAIKVGLNKAMSAPTYAKPFEYAIDAP